MNAQSFTATGLGKLSALGSVKSALVPGRCSTRTVELFGPEIASAGTALNCHGRGVLPGCSALAQSLSHNASICIAECFT